MILWRCSTYKYEDAGEVNFVPAQEHVLSHSLFLLIDLAGIFVDVRVASQSTASLVPVAVSPGPSLAIRLLTS
jgi:hypothetical protein